MDGLLDKTINDLIILVVFKLFSMKEKLCLFVIDSFLIRGRYFSQKFSFFLIRKILCFFMYLFFFCIYFVYGIK